VIDLFDGRVFDDYELARQWVEPIGYHPFIEKACAAVQALPPRLVHVGFSAGAVMAQIAAVARPAAGAVLIAGAARPADFGLPTWPGIPAQVHYGASDPLHDPAGVAGFVADARASGARVDVFDYPVAGHLFTDETLTTEYDAAATTLVWQRVVAFVNEVGSTST